MKVILSGSNIIMNNTIENVKLTHNKEKIMTASSLKLIKLASIIMGMLIILGIIALIFGLQQKFSEVKSNFSERTIYLKQGQIIQSLATDAAGGILLLIHHPHETEQKQLILSIDKSGTVKSRIYIVTE